MDPMIDYFEALENWAEARDAYRKAVAQYDGPSPDYALWPWRNRLTNATEALKDAFANAVRFVVDRKDGPDAD